MKDKLLLIIGIGLISLFSNAQNPNFRKSYDVTLFDIAGGMLEAPNGDYLFAGGGIQAIITRLDNQGNVNWCKNYNAGFISQFTDLKRVSTGGYILCGTSSSGGAILTRIDEAGLVTWSKKYTYPDKAGKTSNEYATAVIETSDGGFAVVGGVDYFWDGVSANTVDTTSAMGFKVDNAGALLWNRVWTMSNPTKVDEHFFNDVTEGIDGYYFVGESANEAGAYNSDGDLPRMALFVKVDKTTGIQTYISRWSPSSSVSAGLNSAIRLNVGANAGKILVGGYSDYHATILVEAGTGGSPSFTYNKRLQGTALVPFFTDGNTFIITELMENPDGHFSMLGTHLFFPKNISNPFTLNTMIVKLNNSSGAILIGKDYPPIGLSSLLPKGGLASDGGFITCQLDQQFTGFNFNIIKTDNVGNIGSAVTTCSPVALNPTISAYSYTLVTPASNMYTSMTGANTTTVVSVQGITPDVHCLVVACVPPAAATTVTASPNPICGGQTTVITASGPATLVTYNVYAAATGGASLGSTPFTTPVLNGNTTYYIETANNSDPSCVSTTRTIVNVTVNTPTATAFTALGPYCVGGTPGTLSTTSDNGVTGTWSPSAISTASAGTTTYTFTPTAGLCATTATMNVTINANTTPTFTALGPYCVGATPGTLSTTSNNGITGTWSPATVSTASAGTITYTFTPTAGLCATTTTMNVTVNTITTPTFTALGPYCVGSTPGSLPTTSNNGVTGTWSPSTVSTASGGTTTYTFTPTAGLCATAVTMDIIINANTAPTFTVLGPYCVGTTPGTLSTTSDNGVTGTWSPSAISTASAGTTTYTFTPTAGLCATTATMNVTINANTTPTFTALGPYCVGATPGTLSTTSNNGITGTWSAATVSTASAGTITYTFTPTAGLCATTTTMNVTVNTITTPTFTALGPYCVGATPGSLATTSNNGVTGTWSPSTVSTASAGTTTYTFTPTAGLCATAVTMDIIINANTTPTFTALGPYCVGTTPGTLSTTSINGVTGTWSPSTVSTASVGTTTYTFTPTAGLCATTATMDITINTSVTPTFTALGPYCVGATPGTLPTTSNNGITGTWSPVTVSTASAGTITYTFTPSGSCATTTSMAITVNTITTPTFTALGPYCVGATPGTLPTTSNNGVTGTWSPSTISTVSVGTTIYTFTPTAGLCATTATMNITVNTSVTPAFTVLGPYCVGTTPGILPTTSNNGVTGTWSPSTISTASAGTTTYTFTPSVGSCATTATMNVTVNTSVTPAFTALGPYCSGAAAGALPTTSNNGVTGTWSPAAISTASIGTTTYTFTPSVGSCGSITTMDVIINTNTTPTFTVLGPYCIGATPGTLPTTSTNGITGTWSPSAISTTSAGTVTYIFTPTAGLCATNAPMNVTINSNITPVFTALGPYCIGDTPGTLPTTSTNGVTGTWSPATVSTASTGTTPYTFTPISGSCATSTILSIIVNAPPIATITGNNSVCEGQGTTLTANGGSPYLWSSGQTTQSITVTPTSITTYSVIIGAGCTSTASINVVVNPLPNPNVGPDVTITQFTQDTLSASGGGTYQWSPSNGLSCDTCANPIANPSSTTVYCVTVTNASGCSDSACVTVTVDIICGDLFVPSAFSPNGDNQNDILYVKSNCIVDMDFAIFDRWGEKVFETNDVNIGWDGTVKGKPLDTAVFAYYLKGTIKGQAIDLHGNITLTK